MCDFFVAKCGETSDDFKQVIDLAPVKEALASKRIRTALERWDALGVAPLSIRTLVGELGGGTPTVEPEPVRERVKVDKTALRRERAVEQLLVAAKQYARALNAESWNPAKEAEALAQAALKFDYLDTKSMTSKRKPT